MLITEQKITKVTRNLVDRINYPEKYKEKKEQKRLKKLKAKESRYEKKEFYWKTFGKTRYYLAELFGNWVYFTNNKPQERVLYQKFYSTKKVAEKYAKKLNQRYTTVEIKELYDKKVLVGYLLQGKGNMIEQSKSNIIPFPTKDISIITSKTK